MYDSLILGLFAALIALIMWAVVSDIQDMNLCDSKQGLYVGGKCIKAERIPLRGK